MKILCKDETDFRERSQKASNIEKGSQDICKMPNGDGIYRG